MAAVQTYPFLDNNDRKRFCADQIILSIFGSGRSTSVVKALVIRCLRRVF